MAADRTERPLRGILCLLGATLCFSLSDAMTKQLVAGLPTLEVAWVRYGVFLMMALSPMLVRRTASLRTRKPRLQVLRGLGIVASSLFFMLGLGHLPLAEAASVSFASPLFITVLAVVLLGERVEAAGWASLAVGFLGVLVVIRPGLGGFHPAALFVVLSSLCWAAAMIVSRRLAGTERPTTTLAWTAATGFAVLSLLLPFALAPIGTGQLGLTLLMGVVASGGQVMAVLAYREAAASVLAPLSYAQLVWSSALGVLMFGSLPDVWTLVGALFIAGSGLSSVQRERRRLRLLAASAASATSSRTSARAGGTASAPVG